MSLWDLSAQCSRWSTKEIAKKKWLGLRGNLCWEMFYHCCVTCKLVEATEVIYPIAKQHNLFVGEVAPSLWVTLHSQDKTHAGSKGPQQVLSLWCVWAHVFFLATDNWICILRSREFLVRNEVRWPLFKRMPHFLKHSKILTLFCFVNDGHS